MKTRAVIIIYLSPCRRRKEIGEMRYERLSNNFSWHQPKRKQNGFGGLMAVRANNSMCVIKWPRVNEANLFNTS